MSALQVSMICKQHGVPLILDACRFAENAYFIKIREEGFRDRTVKSIAQVLYAKDYNSEVMLRRWHVLPPLLGAVTWLLAQTSRPLQRQPKKLTIFLWQEMFSLADGATFSAKKDGLANIGGFLVLRDPDLTERCRQNLILTEGRLYQVVRCGLCPTGVLANLRGGT